MKYNAKFTKIEDGYYRAKINNVELWEVDELLVWTIKEREKEIERLNNIINGLEKYIKESCWKDDWGVESIYVGTLLNKLQELKGSDSNVKD